MEVNIFNDELEVGRVEVNGVSTSSMFIVGDVEHLQLASRYDTPPEAYVYEGIFPFARVTG
ncbi:spore gernimation protein GerPD [Tenuibacillus multivorans]|uniref:Spore germination protein PD n=1 Tax=Tenuibacillus multivorans TaxID=237069 RepID=A0A1H0A2X8_9BACI|nr:spore gernimation protein GerPD [Tenuibacillus multivorans]GEL78350.1 putative spore germination protein GerPD [Tenuibacillus multivorans]SDN27056.1 spore germination protein PD [Tenuibacillus multivorans]